MRLKKWKQMMVSVMTATLLLGMAFPQQSKAEEPTNSPVVKVAGGAFHKLALKEDGTVVAWGHHFLNDTPMPEMKHVKLMDAEGYYSVFVYEDGRVVTWGDGEYSVPKNPPAKLDNVVAVSAGFRHVLALKEDGTVVAWGDSPGAKVPANLGKIVAIDAGHDISLAVDDKGKVYSWGDSEYVPPDLGPVKAVSAGDHTLAALQWDGKVVLWDSSLTSPVPPASLVDVKEISAARSHTLILKKNGTLVTIPDIAYAEKDKLDAQLKDVKDIDTTMYENIAVLGNGKVVTWGRESKPYEIPDDIREPGFNTNLKGVRILGENDYGSYDFFQTPAKRTSRLTVPYGVNRISLTPETEDPHVSSVDILTNAGKQTAGTPFSLGNGPTFAAIKVTAEDQRNSKGYSLRIYQTLSHNATNAYDGPDESLSDGKMGIKAELKASDILPQLGTEDELDQFRIHVNAQFHERKNADVMIPGAFMQALKNKNPDAILEIGSYSKWVRFPITSLSVDQIAKDEGVSPADLMFIVQLRAEPAPLYLQSLGLERFSPVYRHQLKVKVNDQLKEINLPEMMETVLSNHQSISDLQVVAARLHSDSIGSLLPFTKLDRDITIKHHWNEPFFFAQNNIAFKDISGLWNESQVKKLAAKRIVQGKGDGIFGPNESTSRLQFAVMLTRALGLQSNEPYNGQFSDVKGTEWFVPELMSAVQTGIIKGKGDGTFSPYQLVTREQAVAMIGRAMKAVGYEPLKLDETKNVNHLTDEQEIGAWAREDINLLLQAQILSGKSDGTFDPRAHATRAQMVKMLDQFLIFIEYGN